MGLVETVLNLIGTELISGFIFILEETFGVILIETVLVLVDLDEKL
jgi:hypothetical protein